MERLSYQMAVQLVDVKYLIISSRYNSVRDGIEMDRGRESGTEGGRVGGSDGGMIITASCNY